MTASPSDPRIQSLRDLLTYHERVLELTQAAPFGAQLMLADPVRFLRESGLEVDDRFVRELDEAHSKWREGAKRYDEIKSGKAPECRLEVRLRSLGEVGKGLSDGR
jgi:hypothetical protein